MLSPFTINFYLVVFRKKNFLLLIARILYQVTLYNTSMDFYENLKRYAKVSTISIAFPSSIFDNTPTPHLEAYLVGQIARAAVVFNVTEVVIFQEDSNEDGGRQIDRLVKLFEYAECPQYLRKRIFGIEPDLKYAGIIHPLEAQHHLRTSQIECPYREGVTVKHSQVEVKGKQKDVTEVNIGLSVPVNVPDHLELNTRVTIKVDPHDLKKMQSMLAPAMQDKPEALVVAPVEPVEKLNLFWGYYVRKASCLSDVLNNNIFVPEKKSFYDLIVGTSERGVCIDEITFEKGSKSKTKIGDENAKKKHKSDFNHILVVFGGVRGLEHSASCDKNFKDCSDVSKLFDYYINTCPNQGSTTIRTEEAILITLSAMRPKLNLQ